MARVIIFKLCVVVCRCNRFVCNFVTLRHVCMLRYAWGRFLDPIVNTPLFIFLFCENILHFPTFTLRLILLGLTVPFQSQASNRHLFNFSFKVTLFLTYRILKILSIGCSGSLFTLQRGVRSTARHSVKITCRGVTSPARHAARSHSFVYISTS